MTSILDKQITLALNRNWQCLDFRSVKKAVSDITSLNSETGEPPFMFLDLEYLQREDGSYDTDNLLGARPVSVAQWLALPIRSCDLAINCGKYQLRAPTIIVATGYDKVQFRRPKFSSDAVWQRDNSTCQITGEKVTRETGDLGHDIARAKGGKRTWSNVGVVKKTLNRAMGTKSFGEMGWTHVKFTEPKARPVFYTMDDIKHPSHAHFVERN